MKLTQAKNPLETFKHLVKLEHKLKQDLNISMSEIGVLVVVSERKEQKMGDLVSKVELPMSTVTGIVDKLVAKGLAIREKRADDKRVLILKITELGKSLLLDCNSYILELITSLSCPPQLQSEMKPPFEPAVEYYENNISRKEIKIEWD